MSARHKLLILSLLAICILSVIPLNVHPSTAQTDSTESKLKAAESAVEQAFGVVLDAEKAGANVSALLFRLNVAADLLAQAETAYRSGDSTMAANKADSVLPLAMEVSSAAQVSESEALITGQNAFWYTLAFSIMGSVFFVLALFFVWRWLKTNYIKRFLDAKPEVKYQ